MSYVNTSEHRYLDDPIHKEEGGTPDIIGSIRAGLVFQLKSAVGHQLIRQKDDFITRAIKNGLPIQTFKYLEIQRLGVCPSISFMIKHGKRKLHYNFVVALLNDVFRIYKHEEVVLVLDHMVTDYWILIRKHLWNLKRKLSRVVRNQTWLDSSQF